MSGLRQVGGCSGNLHPRHEKMVACDAVGKPARILQGWCFKVLLTPAVLKPSFALNSSKWRSWTKIWREMLFEPRPYQGNTTCSDLRWPSRPKRPGPGPVPSVKPFTFTFRFGLSFWALVSAWPSAADPPGRHGSGHEIKGSIRKYNTPDAYECMFPNLSFHIAFEWL